MSRTTGPARRDHGRRFGTVDLLANIAGVVNLLSPDTVVDLTEEAWDDVLGIDLKGVWMGMRAVIPTMQDNGGGRIVNISSLAALRGLPNLASYSAAKGGVIGLTQQAAFEYAPDNILINAIAPGTIDTPILADITEEMIAANSRAHIINRLGKPEEIAAMATYFCTEDANFLTGLTYPVDGGWSVKGNYRGGGQSTRTIAGRSPARPPVLHADRRRRLRGLRRPLRRRLVGRRGRPVRWRRGRDAVLARLEENVIRYEAAAPTPATSRPTSTSTSTATGTASGTCYVTVLQSVPPDFPLQPIFTGFYRTASSGRRRLALRGTPHPARSRRRSVPPPLGRHHRVTLPRPRLAAPSDAAAPSSGASTQSSAPAAIRRRLGEHVGVAVAPRGRQRALGDPPRPPSRRARRGRCRRRCRCSRRCRSRTRAAPGSSRSPSPGRRRGRSSCCR